MLNPKCNDEHNLSPYLAADYFADWEDPRITRFTQALVKDCKTTREIAVTLYHHIRDHFYYDPFQLNFDKRSLKASEFVERKAGHCIDKANLLIACARQQNIPARYRFANVKNHLGSENMEKILKTNVIVFHGMAELFIDGKWIKLTPAFNKELCTKLNVAPLDFNGKDDAIFQQKDRKGNCFMEYLQDHGTFATLPIEKLKSAFFKAYPHLKGNYPESN